MCKWRRSLGEATIAAFAFASTSECANALADVDLAFDVEALVLLFLAALFVVADFKTTSVCGCSMSRNDVWNCDRTCSTDGNSNGIWTTNRASFACVYRSTVLEMRALAGPREINIGIACVAIFRTRFSATWSWWCKRVCWGVCDERCERFRFGDVLSLNLNIIENTGLILLGKIIVVLVGLLWLESDCTSKGEEHCEREGYFLHSKNV